MQNAVLPTESERDYLGEIAALKEIIAERDVRIKLLESQILQSKRRQFGASSEKSDANTLQLNLFGEVAAEAPQSPELEEINYKRNKRKGKRKEDLSGLPVEELTTSCLKLSAAALNAAKP